MDKLNLPVFDFQLKNIEDKTYIFDVIRKKYIFLTPEEWVRQHIIHLLIDEASYPKSLFRIESSHRINTLLKRTDVLVYDRNTNPFLLVECKAPDVKLNQQAVSQLLIYNKSKKAPYIMLSNGMQTVCFEIDELESVKQIDKLPKMPTL